MFQFWYSSIFSSHFWHRPLPHEITHAIIPPMSYVFHLEQSKFQQSKTLGSFCDTTCWWSPTWNCDLAGSMWGMGSLRIPLQSLFCTWNSLNGYISVSFFFSGAMGDLMWSYAEWNRKRSAAAPLKGAWIRFPFLQVSCRPYCRYSPCTVHPKTFLDGVYLHRSSSSKVTDCHWLYYWLLNIASDHLSFSVETRTVSTSSLSTSLRSLTGLHCIVPELVACRFAGVSRGFIKTWGGQVACALQLQHSDDHLVIRVSPGPTAFAPKFIMCLFFRCSTILEK